MPRCRRRARSRTASQTLHLGDKVPAHVPTHVRLRREATCTPSAHGVRAYTRSQESCWGSGRKP
jgi:hypothetical protein